MDYTIKYTFQLQTNKKITFNNKIIFRKKNSFSDLQIKKSRINMFKSILVQIKNNNYPISIMTIRLKKTPQIKNITIKIKMEMIMASQYLYIQK